MSKKFVLFSGYTAYVLFTLALWAGIIAYMMHGSFWTALAALLLSMGVSAIVAAVGMPSAVRFIKKYGELDSPS